MKSFIVGVVALLMVVGAGATQAHAVPRIALLNSSNTADFFDPAMDALFPERDYTPAYCGIGLTLAREESNRYWMGWQWAFDHNFLATGPDVKYDYPNVYMTIFDWNINPTDLAGFDILLLSNDVNLSREQMQVIQQWVLKGGILLATFGSGYDEIVTLGKGDTIRNAKGHTDGLHNLWQDPFNKLYTSTAISVFTNVIITNNAAPGPAQGVPLGETFYGRWANLLTGRPLNFSNAYAFLKFYDFAPDNSWLPVDSKKPQPAILSTKNSKGWVVYYAFAPEFNVALEYDVAGHCAGDPAYKKFDPHGNLVLDGNPAPGIQAGTADEVNGYHVPSASAGLLPLMKATVDFLLDLPQ